MQVLGQNTDGAHDCLANIKVFGLLNNSVDYEVEFPAEHLVQRLLLTGLGNAVPRQNQLSVGALKHCGEKPTTQKKFTSTPSSHTRPLNIKLKDFGDFLVAFSNQNHIKTSCAGDHFKAQQISIKGVFP